MPFSSSWSLMKCIANKQTLPYWKFGVDGIMRIANMCSLPMVFFLIQILNKRALLSRNELCRKYALFRIFFYSDLTQTIAIWLRLYSDICPKKWWLEPLVHSGEKPVVHTQCNFSCTTACHLEIHNQIHLGEMSFNCRQCTYACTTAVNLKRHMLTHLRTKPFGCSQCNNTFTTAQNL